MNRAAQMNDASEPNRAPGSGGVRRFLIAASVAEYPKNRAWDRPDLPAAREKVAALFTRLGYHRYDGVPPNPTRQQLTDALNAFCTSPERREDDLLAVYLSCHGDILDATGEHVLITADTDPDRLAYTGLPTAELTRAMLLDTRLRRVLLMLDACYVGQGGNQMAAAALEHLGQTWGTTTGAGLVIVSSAQPHQEAVAGLFPTLLEDAVQGLSVAGHGPDALSVTSVVQHMKDAPKRPGHQRIGLTLVGLDGEPPAFLPNPRHDARLNAVDLAVQQEAAFAAQDRRRETEFLNRLLIRAMGYSSEPGAVPEWWFSGRRTALQDLARWLESGTTVCRTVTAGPGSGKTAVLGMIAVLAHPERRRTVPHNSVAVRPDFLTPGVLDAAVYAQRLTDADVLDALCAAARIRADTVGTLLEALGTRNRERPLTVLIDALDEAATPDSLCSTLLRPLIQYSQGRVRLLLGTRPYLLPSLHLTEDQIVDLDSPRYADPGAITEYAARTLLRAHRTSPYRDHLDSVRPVAREVARAAGHSFLIARITAGTLAAAATIPDPDDPAWRASLPRHAGDAMREDLHRRLGPHAGRAADLLRPLAYAQGQGLPWEDLWAPLAGRVSGRQYTDDDIVWLRLNAGSYIVEATEDNRSAYRLYHEALAEHLRENTDPQAVHAVFAQVLTDRVPRRADGTRDWSRAHPYTLRNLAHHAGQAGQLDQALADSEFLVHARGLAPHLRHARDDAARLNAAVHRTSLHHDTDPPARRQALALGAARAGARDLHRDLTGRIPAGDWAPQWATGSTFNPALRATLTGHTGMVGAVACGVLDGRPVAVTADVDRIVRVWDLTVGQPVGDPFTGHAAAVTAVACAVLDGRPVAVTASDDQTVRLWDLATRQPIGEPLTGHTRGVTAVACAVVNGRPVAVTASDDRTVRVWDLGTRRQIGSPLIGHGGSVNAVACTVLEGRPVAVTASRDHTVWVWDLATGRLNGRPLIGHGGSVNAVTCTVLEGRPVAVTASRDHTVCVWDLATRRPVGRPLTGHTGGVSAVASTALDGRPVAVTASRDHTVWVWDLATGRLNGRPLIGHGGSVNAVTCTVLEGRPVAVTASRDHTVCVWDLATRRPVGRPLTGHTGGVSAVASTALDGRPVVVTAGDDQEMRVWDLATWRPISQPLTGHTGGVTGVECVVLEGHPVAVTVSDDRTVRVWDLATARPVGAPLIGHLGSVTSVAYTALQGRPVAVTGSRDSTVRVWDLATRRPVGAPLVGHTIGVSSVAFTALEGRPVAVTGGWDKSVRVWDLTTGRPLGDPLTGHAGGVTGVECVTLDGRPVAVTVSDDHTVRVWDLLSRQPVGSPHYGHTGGVTAVACAVLEGRAVAVTGSWDTSVRVWDLAAGRQIGQPLAGHTDAVIAVACTTLDGRPVAVTGSWDCTARLWDLTTARPVGHPLTGHTAGVVSISCTDLDGRPVAATAGRDDTVRLWDLRSQTATTTLPVEHPGAVSLTPTGDLVIGFHNDVAHYRRQPRTYPPRS